jgi:hypothetical protein
MHRSLCDIAYVSDRQPPAFSPCSRGRTTPGRDTTPVRRVTIIGGASICQAELFKETHCLCDCHFPYRLEEPHDETLRKRLRIGSSH